MSGDADVMMADPSAVMMGGDGSSAGDRGMLMEVEQAGGGDGEEEEMCQEYVLPADKHEWMKLFDHLLMRLHNQLQGSEPFTPQEREEAESLLRHSENVTQANVEQQINIFQKVCKLTNANI